MALMDSPSADSSLPPVTDTWWVRVWASTRSSFRASLRSSLASREESFRLSAASASVSSGASTVCTALLLRQSVAISSTTSMPLSTSHCHSAPSKHSMTTASMTRKLIRVRKKLRAI